jgi:hypothetical protein
VARETNNPVCLVCLVFSVCPVRVQMSGEGEMQADCLVIHGGWGRWVGGDPDLCRLSTLKCGKMAAVWLVIFIYLSTVARRLMQHHRLVLNISEIASCSQPPKISGSGGAPPVTVSTVKWAATSTSGCRLMRNVMSGHRSVGQFSAW